MVDGQMKKTTLTGFLLGILVFIRTMPFYLWSLESVLRPICAILVMLICIFNISKDKGTRWIFFFVAASYFWAVMFVDHSGIMVLLNFLTFAFITILKREVVFETYKYFRILLITFLSLSLINYLFLRLGWVGVGRIIQPLNEIKDHTYVAYPFVVTSFGHITHRFYAIYDEPGMVGTICGLMLIAEGTSLRKAGNWVLLLAGLLSFSFYFYITLILGLVFFSSKLKFRWLIVPVFAVILAFSFSNPFMYNAVWSRFEWDEEVGSFVGDNRSASNLDAHYESIRGTRTFFVGEGTAVAKKYMNSASLKLIIVKHGFIFVALNLMGFAILSFREIRKKTVWIPFFIFFILTLYQRPGFYAVYSISLYTMVIYILGRNSEKVDNKMEAERRLYEIRLKKRRLKK